MEKTVETSEFDSPLTTLNLSGNECQYIFVVKKLKYIWIWIGQNIGDSGAMMISEVLNSISTLTKLDMSCYEWVKLMWKRNN